MGDNSHVQANASLAELVATYQGPDLIPEPGTTTLMIRNLPRSYVENAVISELQFFSPKSKYDMVYLPWDIRRDSNISYAFVNFCDHESALRAFFALSGRLWSFVRSAKICRLGTAHIQGLSENIANYVANFGIPHDCQHAPTILHEGRCVPLKQAVRLFCTGAMLEKAAELARVKKLSLQAELQAEAVENQRRTKKQVAMEFRGSFQQFCQEIMQKTNFEHMKPQLPDEDDDIDPAAVNFWLRFQQLCLQFSAISPKMPELVEVADQLTPTEVPDDFLDVVNHFSNVPNSRKSSPEALAVAHPPGLVHPKAKGTCFAMPEKDTLFATRNASHSIGQKQSIPAAITSCRDAGTNKFSSPSSDFDWFIKPDEKIVPAPKLLMNEKRHF
jgi:hypothetical protein